MAVHQQDYYRQICPYCRSFVVEPVHMIQRDERACLNGEYTRGEPQRSMDVTGYFCDRCKRYHPFHMVKWTYDRAAMKRDLAALQKMLKKAWRA